MALENLDLISSQLDQLMKQYPWIIFVIVIILIWKLIWYGIAIYKSVEKRQKAWFVVLFVCAFVLNDLGLLPILYLIFNKEQNFRKRKK